MAYWTLHLDCTVIRFNTMKSTVANCASVFGLFLLFFKYCFVSSFSTNTLIMFIRSQEQPIKFSFAQNPLLRLKIKQETSQPRIVWKMVVKWCLDVLYYFHCFVVAVSLLSFIFDNFTFRFPCYQLSDMQMAYINLAEERRASDPVLVSNGAGFFL